MSMIQKVAIFLCGLQICFAQMQIKGACPEVSVQADFSATRYLGKWYEQEKYFATFQLAGRCVTAQYSAEDNGDKIKVLNTQINTVTGKESTMEGEANQVDGAKLEVRFSTAPLPAPYWVLETDYETYSVVWTCNELGQFHTENARILTRARTPPVIVIDKAHAALDKNKLSKERLTKTIQENCPDDN